MLQRKNKNPENSNAGDGKFSQLVIADAVVGTRTAVAVVTELYLPWTGK